MFSDNLKSKIENPKWAHSITRSASIKRCAGILSPRALAVLRLITSSNFVGCSTGKVSGLGSLQDLVHVPGYKSVPVCAVSPVVHEPAGIYSFSDTIHRRHPVL